MAVANHGTDGIANLMAIANHGPKGTPDPVTKEDLKRTIETLQQKEKLEALHPRKLLAGVERPPPRIDPDSV